MGKASGLDKAIEAFKADRAVLDLAIAELEAQRSTPGKPIKTRKPRLVAAETA